MRFYPCQFCRKGKVFQSTPVLPICGFCMKNYHKSMTSETNIRCVDITKEMDKLMPDASIWLEVPYKKHKRW